jgi:hypothetical protein
MDEMYHEGNRELQDRLHTRRLADRIEDLLVLRVNGEASVDFDDELRSWWPEAQFVVRVRVRENFPKFPTYVHRYQKIQESTFVSREDCETPVPSWKRSSWAVDVLPAGDPALDPDATVA